jgi:predicted nicotinamide N-methyase
MDDDPHRKPFAVDQGADFAALHLVAGVVTHLNGVGIAGTSPDLLDTVDTSWQVVTAGDVCYARARADQVTPWLTAVAARGSVVLLGDPGRAYLPRTGMIERARYIVPTSRELEDRDHREAIVWQVLGTRGSD